MVAEIDTAKQEITLVEDGHTRTGSGGAMKPAGLESAPAVVPNVSVETEKSPF